MLERVEYEDSLFERVVGMINSRYCGDCELVTLDYTLDSKDVYRLMEKLNRKLYSNRESVNFNAVTHLVGDRDRYNASISTATGYRLMVFDFQF